MIFSSVTFLFAFLPVVLAVYLAVPRSARNTCLLAASLVFYAWGEPFFVLVLLLSIAVNYGLGLWIDRARGTPASRWAVGTAVASNLALLGWFKYANFAAENLGALTRALGLGAISLDPVHLPIGISFFTFQALTYAIDIHRGDAPVERNPLRAALYISLFPQLIAGPIVRFRDIAREIVERDVRLADFAQGTRRFVMGMGKKVLIANTMGRVADVVFGLPAEELSTELAWLGAASYTLQIYFDFSGYSDMAIGLGRMFGFHFRENFRHPYVARSITEFWRRWHISLSTWFRDYLYIPLGGNRRGTTRTYRNLIIVFALCGLWHGASWSFLLWGLYHGAFLVLERVGRGRLSSRLPAPLAHLWTLLIVLLGWVIFRCESADHIAFFLRAMLGATSAEGLRYTGAMLVDPVFALAFGAGLIGSIPWLEAARRRWEVVGSDRWRFVGEGSALMALVIIFTASVLQLASATHNPFIYFRF
jgi:alginate O-acetyltransferase complex protein AlgI